MELLTVIILFMWLKEGGDGYIVLWMICQMICHDLSEGNAADMVLK